MCWMGFLAGFAGRQGMSKGEPSFRAFFCCKYDFTALLLHCYLLPLLLLLPLRRGRGMPLRLPFLKHRGSIPCARACCTMVVVRSGVLCYSAECCCVQWYAIMVRYGAMQKKCTCFVLLCFQFWQWLKTSSSIGMNIQNIQLV